jgi:sterol desaturase/sphingolipid hydroxylase (fatty acid hydroxylase superfamily)
MHHTFPHPIAINAFYQDPIDLLITNSLPTYVALSLIPSISYFEWNVMLIYKNFIEIAGHSGKKSYPISSFPQFIWLPKWLGMELYTEDHDLHHSLNNCNYSKRFSLWDKAFGTYRT